VLVYREDPAVIVDSPNHMLLRACSLLFLFRAVAMSQSGSHRATLEAQLLRLIADIVPCEGGAILLGRDEDELRAIARERSSPVDLEEIVARVCREGVVVEPTRRTVALILHVRGEIAGELVAWFPAPEAINLSDHRDTLSAISTLAASALETVRDVERLQAENTMLMERLGSGDAWARARAASWARAPPSESSCR
jgi:hypothetical protein